MRALSLVAPRHARMLEVADPVPAAGEVLVRIRGCGVCGSDLNAWRGVSGIQYPLPAGAPGHETWGEVVQLGDGVLAPPLGATVTGLMWNGFAELGVARAEDLVVVPAQTAVLGEPLACAMNVVRRAGLGAGGRFAVVGFGYLAALVVQLLPREVGPWVAVSRRADSRTLALQLGAEAACDFPDVPTAWWDGFPTVIEAAGVQQTLDYAGWLTAYGGRLVIAGYHADGVRTVNLQHWNWKGIDVINAHERQAATYLGALRAALEVVQATGVDLAPLHSHAWPLAEAAEAFGMADERPSGFVKAVLCP